MPWWLWSEGNEQKLINWNKEKMRISFFFFFFFLEDLMWHWDQVNEIEIERPFTSWGTRMVCGTLRLVLFWETFSLDRMRKNDLLSITSPRPERDHSPCLQCETCVFSCFPVSSYLPFPLFPLFLIFFFLPVTDWVLEEATSQSMQCVVTYPVRYRFDSSQR